ncbi:MAG: ribonuclease HII [Chloroflexi bacterium]|jgi:ribonuclease HII|nr:ribonuclease HII [Chloroflexota bacterium]
MPKKFDPALIPKNPTLEFERLLWQAGRQYVAGIDEAGRGALAGPVAAAVVILPPDRNLERSLRGVRDSKQMTPSQREFWSTRLRELVLAFGVGFASSQTIDALGIVPATRLAAQRALNALEITPQHLLLDYLLLPDLEIPQTSLIKGDARSLSIAAASILAKTARDARMVELDQEYPGYGLAAHKGYGTKAHREAIIKLGPSPIHRLSFSPIRDL